MTARPALTARPEIGTEPIDNFKEYEMNDTSTSATMTTDTANEAGDITLTGRPLENAQPGSGGQPTLFEVAQAVQRRGRDEVGSVIPIGASRFGSGLKDSYEAVNDALGAISRAIEHAAQTTAAVAEDNRMYPVGRAEAIDASLESADQVVHDAGEVVPEAGAVLVALLEGEALPKPADDPSGDLATLRAVMDAAPADQRGVIYERLATRNDSLAGWLLSPHGQEYATAMFGDEGGNHRHQVARSKALQGALERGNAHARAARSVSDLVAARGAYVSAWKSIRGRIAATSRGLRDRADAGSADD